MSAILRFSGAGKHDPVIEEWLVGFFHGAHLDDPAGLLEGTGKNMRHVKLKPGHEPDPVVLGSLIDAAYLDLKTRLRAE